MVRFPARPIFFPRIDDSHCDMIHSSLTAVRCFDNGYVGKQSVAWKEYPAEYWLKGLQESMDRCSGHRDITEILLNTIQPTSIWRREIRLVRLNGWQLFVKGQETLLEKRKRKYRTFSINSTFRVPFKPFQNKALFFTTLHNSADSVPISNLVCIKEVAIRTTFSHMINIAGIIYYTCS